MRVCYLKQGLNVDDDWLADLASNHMGIRSLAGLATVLNLKSISAAKQANNISCLTDDDWQKINAAIVRLAHKTIGHQAEERLMTHGDSFATK